MRKILSMDSSNEMFDEQGYPPGRHSGTNRD